MKRFAAVATLGLVGALTLVSCGAKITLEEAQEIANGYDVNATSEKYSGGTVKTVTNVSKLEGNNAFKLLMEDVLGFKKGKDVKEDETRLVFVTSAELAGVSTAGEVTFYKSGKALSYKASYEDKQLGKVKATAQYTAEGLAKSSKTTMNYDSDGNKFAATITVTYTWKKA